MHLEVHFYEKRQRFLKYVAFINFLTRVFPYTDLVTGGSDLQQLDILPPHLRRAGGRVRAGAGDVLHHQECR